MSKSKKQLVLLVIIIALILLGGIFFRFQSKLAPAPLPLAISYNAISKSQSQPQAQNPTPLAADPILPAEVNLQIPFVSQAPHQNWDLPYQQFCEEASVLMAVSYLNNRSVLSPNDADAQMLAIRDFEIKKFGYYEDTTAEETALILREYYKLEKVAIVSNPVAADIKKALAEGKAVIVPLAGRQLNNPYYQQPGPLYHMLVIKGYKKNGDFITNDPGTKHGADFIYKVETIMKAIHDWNESDINAGGRVILMVG